MCAFGERKDLGSVLSRHGRCSNSTADVLVRRGLSRYSSQALGTIAVITPVLFVSTVSSVVVDTRDSAPSAVLKVGANPPRSS